MSPQVYRVPSVLGQPADGRAWPPGLPSRLSNVWSEAANHSVYKDTNNAQQSTQGELAYAGYACQRWARAILGHGIVFHQGVINGSPVNPSLLKQDPAFLGSFIPFGPEFVQALQEVGCHQV